MPIVFVHGVNNRKDQPSYKARVARVDSCLKEILAPRLGLPSKDLGTFFPYWGGFGAKFRYGQASLPSEGPEAEAFALKEDAALSDATLWIAAAQTAHGGEVLFSQVAVTGGLEAAIDLAWDTAAIAATTPMDLSEIARLYEASLAYAKQTPLPPWLLKSPTMGNDQFMSELVNAVSAAGNIQAMGLGNWWQAVKETVSRIADKPGDLAGTLLTKLGRRNAHMVASVFLGDIFVYLDERGTDKTPGDIVKSIVTDLEAAIAVAAASADKRLVVVAHSLGGVIMWDILTYFRPDIKIDTLVTVGSQVGVFQELALYRNKSAGVVPPTKVKRPDNVGTWLNVYDTNDVFSFATTGVFEGSSDFSFDTGYGVFSAHGGYFERPSFYKRLAMRLVDGK
jgi:hypothetical protein